jgi:hypothetical protein
MGNRYALRQAGHTEWTVARSADVIASEAISRVTAAITNIACFLAGASLDDD